MKKEYIVFSQRIAGWLMLKGFVLKRMEKSTRHNSNRNVFIFNDTEELHLSIKEYQSINN
jgi:hypothetical protein